MAAFLAELAEAAGRFDDMRGHVKCLVEQRLRGDEEGCQERPTERQPTPMLSERERNLLSAAYKASLAPRRSALKAISKIICKEENEGNLDKITCATKYSMSLKAEAEGICCELLGMVQQLVLQTEGSEHIVFYHKMQGDYYRHLAEILEGTAKIKAVKLSRWKYDQAEILAERDLEITNPIRLAVVLNYSILIAELDDDHRAARRKARRTYDAALQQLDYIPEDKYKDATLILQLLRDVAQEPLWADQ